MYPVLFNLPEWVPILGSVPITSFGVMVSLSFLTAAWVLRVEMERMALDASRAWDLVLIAAFGGILGSKVYYVLLNYRQLLEDPIGTALARGGMVWYGGFLLASALVIWKAPRLGLGVPKILDASAPALPLAYAVGRLGCFLVGDDYGRPTDFWVGIAFPNGTPPTRVDVLEQYFGVRVDAALVEKYGEVVPVHPTQLYEIGLSLLIFVVVWRMRRHRHATGWLFAVWLALAGVERFTVEIFRVKDDRFFGYFTVAQGISLALLAIGVGLAARLRKPDRAPEHP